MKLLTDIQTKKLIELLESIWNEQKMPASWKLIKAIPILKPSKDSNTIERFRVISLLNVIYKLFNKYIQINLKQTILGKNMLPEKATELTNTAQP